MRTIDFNKKQSFAYAHLKRDGHLYYLRRDMDGNFRWLTSNFNVKQLDWLITPEMSLCWPRGLEVIGELFYPGHPASQVSRAIANKDTALQFEAFSIRSVSFALPHYGLESARDIVTAMTALKFIPFYRINATVAVNQQLATELLAQGIDEHGPDFEGLVFKDFQYDALGGNSHKWKPVNTADLQVVGVAWGEGKFSKLIGSLIVATADGKVVANVSGMTDAERHNITVTHALDGLVGKIVEVAYQYVAAKGKLRHPRFVRFRGDKLVADKEVF